MKKSFFLLILLLPAISFSQELQQGNIIPEYGKTYVVDSPCFNTDTTSMLKAVFDVDRSFDAGKPNALIETAARYLNMHEQAGVASENMNVALVIHGKAVKDVLKDEFYKQEYPAQISNPNLPLIIALSEVGVKVILCGQSAAHYKVTKDEAVPQVDFALSAMTALVQLQNDEYRLIKF
jgi:intracellular sulfur oxidation DsrE/DsrF family protein